MSRLDWNSYFLEIASVVAKRSTCPRLAVGAVITLDNKIVTTGYNGATAGESHCTEIGCHLVDGHCKRVVHAERNALDQLVKLSSRMVIYITHEPCSMCRTEIARHGISSIVWDSPYEVT
jgi:dCMP deaminase